MLAQLDHRSCALDLDRAGSRFERKLLHTTSSLPTLLPEDRNILEILMQGQKGDCDSVRLLPPSADECTFVRENCKSGKLIVVVIWTSD